jgi:hypothetical protein
MNKVTVEFECGCFRKSEFTKESEYSSKEEAKEYSNKVIDYMNNKTCGKHTFSLLEDNNDFLINVKAS